MEANEAIMIQALGSEVPDFVKYKVTKNKALISNSVF